MEWDWAFVWEILPALLDGLKVTVLATLGGSLVALVLGLIWAIGRRSPIKPLSVGIAGFTEFIRRTPLLVQLYFFFLVMPTMGVTLSALTVGIVAIGLHYSTYTGEIYRAGINSIGKGQWEAAHALDFSTPKTWAHVILPQAVPKVIPSLGNTVIQMFKETALLSAITVQELMWVAQDIGTTTYIYTEPLLTAAFLYLVISYGSSLIVRGLERRFSQGRPALVKSV
ncbi:ectoine/hydroxyectoine ABC transporter permease subunit EhuD [Gordonia sp. GN26]